MTRVFLQHIIEDLKFEDLPANWNSFDLESFSKNKKLWDYQQSAVKNAIKVLWKYFEDFRDYQKDEGIEANLERKQKFFKWYKDNGLDENLDIKLDKRKRNIILPKIEKFLMRILSIGCVFGWQPEVVKLLLLSN
ncbi:MAG: hypothetical protein ACE5KE_01790 [Methanosarcinales archaeon]